MPAKRKSAAVSFIAPVSPLNLQERINQHTLDGRLVAVSAIRVVKPYSARKPSTSRWMEISRKCEDKKTGTRPTTSWSCSCHRFTQTHNTPACVTLHTNTYTQTPTGTATIAPRGSVDRPIDNRGIRSDAARTSRKRIDGRVLHRSAVIFQFNRPYSAVVSHPSLVGDLTKGTKNREK